MIAVFSRRHLGDWLNIAWLTVVGLALSAFYLSGQMLDTGYPDWMYHAFRAESFQQHGLVSMDAVWNNGLSYWRGYQFVTAALTAGVATVLHVSITQAMLIITTAAFTVFHPILYVCLRVVRRRPGVAALVAALSFAYSGYWVTIGFYSIMFATILVPPLLALWYRSLEQPRLQSYFAAAVGLSVYVHPLLATCFGGLWALTFWLRRENRNVRGACRDVFIMAALSFFYWYQLIFADIGHVAPYQLEKDFLYTVAASLKFGFIYYVIVPVVAFGAILTSHRLSSPAKYLFWYTALLYLIIILNIHTDLIDGLNRYQLYRVGFFIGVALLFVFAEMITDWGKRWPRAARQAAFALVLGVGIAQSMIDSSVYGFVPVNKVADPVGTFLTGRPNPVGSIYIADSTAASYYHPQLRYSNGYNDQLLPQLANVRLRNLLSVSEPDYRVRPETITQIDAYVRVLGVEYLFLPANSPYIGPLTTRVAFKVVGASRGDTFDMVVLSPSTPVANAVALDDSQLAALRDMPAPDHRLPADSYYAQLDRVMVQMAALQASPLTHPVLVQFEAPDRVKLEVTGSNSKVIKLNQSFSRQWAAEGASISRTADNMMLVKLERATPQVRLRHSWGPSPMIQLGLMAVVGLYLIYEAIGPRRNRS